MQELHLQGKLEIHQMKQENVTDGIKPFNFHYLDSYPRPSKNKFIEASVDYFLTQRPRNDVVWTPFRDK